MWSVLENDRRFVREKGEKKKEKRKFFLLNISHLHTSSRAVTLFIYASLNYSLYHVCNWLTNLLHRLRKSLAGINRKCGPCVGLRHMRSEE